MLTRHTVALNAMFSALPKVGRWSPLSSRQDSNTSMKLTVFVQYESMPPHGSQISFPRQLLSLAGITA